jgi:hypothetical protein
MVFPPLFRGGTQFFSLGEFAMISHLLLKLATANHVFEVSIEALLIVPGVTPVLDALARSISEETDYIPKNRRTRPNSTKEASPNQPLGSFVLLFLVNNFFLSFHTQWV